MDALTIVFSAVFASETVPPTLSEACSPSDFSDLRGFSIAVCALGGVVMIMEIISFILVTKMKVVSSALLSDTAIAFHIPTFMLCIPLFAKYDSSKHSCGLELAWPVLAFACGVLGMVCGFASGKAFSGVGKKKKTKKTDTPNSTTDGPDPKTPDPNQSIVTPGQVPYSAQNSQAETSQPLLYKNKEMINYGGIPSDQVPAKES